MIIRVFVAVVSLTMSAMAMADLAYKASQGLRGLKSANIFVEDQITDGCWSNPSRSAYKARKIFVDGGIRSNIGRDTPSQAILYIRGTGKKLRKGLCVINITEQLGLFARANLPYSEQDAFVFVELASASYLMWGSPRYTQDFIDQNVSQWTTEILEEWLKQNR